MSARYDCDVSLCTQLYANKMYIAVTTRSKDNTDEYGIELYIWDSKHEQWKLLPPLNFPAL